jgi:hypothetical protein
MDDVKYCLTELAVSPQHPESDSAGHGDLPGDADRDEDSIADGWDDFDYWLADDLDLDLDDEPDPAPGDFGSHDEDDDD